MKSKEEIEMERTQEAVRELEQALRQARRDADEAWRAYIRAPQPIATAESSGNERSENDLTAL